MDAFNSHAKEFMSDSIKQLCEYAEHGRWQGVSANNFTLIDEDNLVYIRLSYEVEWYYAHNLELYMDCDKDSDPRIYYAHTVAHHTMCDSISNYVSKICTPFYKIVDNELRKHGIVNDNPYEWYYVTDETNAVQQFTEFLDIMIPLILQADFSMKDDPEPSNKELSIKDKVEDLFGSKFEIISPREEFNQKVREGKFIEYRK
jgi:hypothetical protein